MTVKKRGLGRGLDALLKTMEPDMEPDMAGALAAEPAEGSLRSLPIERIVNGRFQPRRTMHPDRLQELADSIRVQGVVQPIVVRPAGEQRYEIIAGERRWRAARMAGLDEIPAVVRDIPEQAALAIALIENIQREDLNPLEEAMALRRLIDEFRMTHQQVAEAIGRSRAAVSNLLRLLELDSQVQQLVQEGRLEMGHARALLSLAPELQREAAQQVLLRGLSVREAEALARRLQQPGAGDPAAAPALDPNIRALQEDLSERLGARVLVRQSDAGRGKLVIHYNTLDELDGIISHLK